MLVNLPKAADTIKEPDPLPEDWYTLEILEEPLMEENKALRERGADDPKAGHNVVIRMGVVDAEEEHNGRRFTSWLPMPKPEEDKVFTPSGQTVLDFKMKRMVQYYRAFVGLLPDDEFSDSDLNFTQGMRAQFYVIQELSQDGQTVQNGIDFRSVPRPVMVADPLTEESNFAEVHLDSLPQEVPI